MRFGVNALIWTADVNSFDPRVLAAIREAGFTAFEVPMFEPGKMNVPRIRSLLSENGLECTVCCLPPPECNAVSVDGGRPAANTRALSAMRRRNGGTGREGDGRARLRSHRAPSRKEANA